MCYNLMYLFFTNFGTILSYVRRSSAYSFMNISVLDVMQKPDTMAHLEHSRLRANARYHASNQLRQVRSVHFVLELRTVVYPGV